MLLINPKEDNKGGTETRRIERAMDNKQKISRLKPKFINNYMICKHTKNPN